MNFEVNMNNSLKPKVLLFNVTPEKSGVIADICIKLGAECITTSPFEHEKMMGELIGMPFGNALHKDAAIDNSGPVAGEMLVFSMLSDDQLDEFLLQYRQSALPPIALKAAITPYNIVWTPKKLYQELSKEHKEMNKKK